MGTVFNVHGPCTVPTYVGKAAKTITDENVREFWRANGDLASARGCYVFGIRAGKGLTVAYVGKATKTFKQEALSPLKLTRYLQVLADYQKGTPVLFFLVAPTRKGKPNNSHVGELENFLIQTGVAANPDLMNIQGTKEADWGIAGILRGGKGKPSAAAKKFRTLMKM
jgi:hypothetical protein